MVVRPVDVLCETHQDQLLVRWQHPGPPGDLFQRCRPCGDRLYGKFPDGVMIRPFRDTPARQMWWKTCLHEAAHAVVQSAVGLTVTRLWATPAVDSDTEESKPNGGSEANGAIEDNDWAAKHGCCAALWAGQAAIRRYLAEARIDTRSNRIDESWSAFGDALSVSEQEWAATCNPDDDMARARELVDRHWATIVQLTEVLCVARELDGPRVHRLIARYPTRPA